MKSSVLIIITRLIFVLWFFEFIFAIKNINYYRSFYFLLMLIEKKEKKHSKLSFYIKKIGDKLVFDTIPLI